MSTSEAGNTCSVSKQESVKHANPAQTANQNSTPKKGLKHTSQLPSAAALCLFNTARANDSHTVHQPRTG
jgi:hypothetical protein